MATGENRAGESVEEMSVRDVLVEINAMLTEALAVLGSVIPTPCLLYTSPSPRDRQRSRMPSSA